MKTTVIVPVTPPASSQGTKGVRNHDDLSQIFKSPYSNPSNVVGNFPASADGTPAKSNPINFTSDNSYRQWYIDNVVNGVVNDGGYYGIDGESNFNMNYLNAPNLEVDSPGRYPYPIDENGNVLATNYFVPHLKTLNSSLDAVKTDDPALLSAKNAIEKKASIPPGSGESIVGNNSGVNPRNPSKTSAEQKSSAVMVLGKFLKASNTLND